MLYYIIPRPNSHFSGMARLERISFVPQKTPREGVLQELNNEGYSFNQQHTALQNLNRRLDLIPKSAYFIEVGLGYTPCAVWSYVGKEWNTKTTVWVPYHVGTQYYNAHRGGSTFLYFPPRGCIIGREGGNCRGAKYTITQYQTNALIKITHKVAIQNDMCFLR